MSIDESTGLPELPKGHYWRVKKDAAGTRVHLMRERRFLADISTRSKYIIPKYTGGNVEAAIRVAAKDVLLDLRHDEKLELYTGDYPPKKLEK